MHKLRKIALFLGLIVAACREPTAPEARNIARSMEKKFAAGDLRGVHEMFMFLGGAGNAWSLPQAQNEALHIVRDGVPQVVNGFVFEEVLVAPGGIGKPLVRRSMAGWPKDYEFAVFAFSDTHPGTARPRPENWVAEPHQGATNMLVHLRGDSLRSWVQDAGIIDIGDAVIDRECGESQEPLAHTQGSPTERVTCHFALFEVAVRGQFLTRADQQNRALRSFQHRHHLEIPRQRVPGIRFVTTCPERPDLPDEEDFDCLEPIRFWRDNAQYAPSLGVDVASMRRSSGAIPGWYTRVEKWSDGKAHEHGQVRYTIHAPDGRLLKSGKRLAADETELARQVDDWLLHLNVQPDVRRLQAIVPARFIDRSAPPYEVWVLGMEFLGPQ
jgi:hypothetical protein